MGLFQEPLEHHGNDQFDRLLGEGFIVYSRTDIMTKIPKYTINVDKVEAFSNGLERRNLYASIGDEITSVDALSKCRHVSIVSKSIDQATLFEKLEGNRELRTVLLIRNYGNSLREIPYTFFEAHRFMQALDLSGSHISELPSSIGVMTQLRFLDLSFTLIQSIPESVDELRELQTLKLQGCKCLHVLPDNTKELTSLRHLDFDMLGQLSFMPGGMGSLTELRTLSAFIMQGEAAGCSLKELKNMNNLCGSFCISGLEYARTEDAVDAAMREKKHITGLHLQWNGIISYDELSQSKAFSTLKSLEPNNIPSLQELKISCYPGSKFPSLIQSSDDFKQLVKVSLFDCENKTFIDLESASSLKHLHVKDMDEVANIDHSNDRVKFPSLETLVIDGMLNLKCWTGVVAGDFPHLTNLTVKHCPKLTKLDFLPILHSLRFLEISSCKSFECLPEDPLPTFLDTLKICWCPLLKRRCFKGGEDWEQIKHVSSISIELTDIVSAKQNREENLDKSMEEEETTTTDESEEDIAYHSETMVDRCRCGIPVVKQTSWTHENPGRKFVACKFFNHETGHTGCNTFEWLDEGMTEWQRDVINVLVAEKHRLATDNNILQERMVCDSYEKRRVKEELEKLKNKVVKNAPLQRESNVVV